MKVSRLLCGMAVLAAPLAVDAQTNTSTSGVGIGILGGATFPVGTYNDVAATGFNVGAFFDFGRRLGPAGVRADVMYHGFGDRNLVTQGENTTQVTFSNKYSMVNGTLNLVLGVPLEESPVRPYLIGGVGAYYMRNSPKCVGANCGSLITPADDDVTKLGFNGGGGLEFGLGGASAFLEARYHHVLQGMPDVTCLGQSDCNRAAAKLVPLNLGIALRF